MGHLFNSSRYFLRLPTKTKDHAPTRRVHRIRPMVEQLEDRLAPAMVTVSTVQDLVDGNTGSIADLIANPGDDGKISLREAVIAGNNTNGADAIDFDLGAGTHQIILGGTELAIAGDTTINGPGADVLTIDGNNNSRIFNISSGIDVEIVGLTLTRGFITGNGFQFYGAAIHNLGSLTLKNSTVSNNQGQGGIASAGNLTISGSNIDNNAGATVGGIYNVGTATVSDSSFTGNANAFSGGAIFSSNALTVTRSTFFAGSAATLFNTGTATVEDSTFFVSGGIENTGTLHLTGSTLYNGNGIRNLGGTANITNTTISNNSSGLSNEDGASVLQNVTISENTAGIFVNFGSVTLKNTIVAKNDGAPDLVTNTPGAFISQGNNLIGDVGAATGFAPYVKGDLVGGAGNPVIDPKLGALADNGGPTLTHAPQTGSPAIDNGNNVGAPAADQRGFNRPADGNGNGFAVVDIGAYEVQSLSLVVDNEIDESDGDFSPGDLSLREAVELANKNPGPDSISFAGSLSGKSITLGGAEIAVTTDVTIAGPGADLLAIDGDNASRIFNVSAAGRLEVTGLTLQHGNVPAGSGGAIINNGGALSVTDCTIANNAAGGIGGGIANEGGNVNVTRCTVTGNSSSTGGGLYNRGGTMTLANSTVSTNSVTGGGGGLVTNNNGLTSISNSTITLNTASFGGGFHSDSGTSVSIHNSIVATNTPDNISGGFSNLGNNILAGDPKLGPLAFNGGPTKTHALLDGSPAIDAGNNANAPATDQRGLTRIVDGDGNGTATIDIGAFELDFYDYGDAPLAAGSGFANDYPTKIAVGGAFHIAAGPTLGAERDTESDGQPTANADGDDADNPDDEDGVQFVSGSLIVTAASAKTGQVKINLQNADSGSNKLDAWIDFNRDGDWDDNGEQIFTSKELGASNGEQTFDFSIPAGTLAGDTYARFRLSTSGGLTPGGFASDGEVEDYKITLLPELTIDDVILTEGDSGDKQFSFNVTRSQTNTAISVNYATADGSAKAGSDFTGIGSTALNFAANGPATMQIHVNVSGEAIVETDESFFVNLLDPTGAIISDSQGQGTIANDDTATLTASSVTKNEEDSGDTIFTFDVKLDNDVQGGLTTRVDTADGTAKTGDNDYQTLSNQQLDFNGTKDETLPVQVTVKGDTKVEADETFDFILTLLSAPPGVSTVNGKGTIVNDDKANLMLVNVTKNEGDSGDQVYSFDVKLDNDVQGGLTIAIDTKDGTAKTSDNDYLANSGTRDFLGTKDEIQTFEVTVNGDLRIEPNEAFDIVLGDLTNIDPTAADDITKNNGVGTITNDDFPDYGDAPDPADGTAARDYQTRKADNGPLHTINGNLRIGAAIDSESDGQPNTAADGDDANGDDDEDGLVNPVFDVIVVEGQSPKLRVRVTNNTGAAAKLYGWIDFNSNGVFDNATERAEADVPDGTTDGNVTLTFPQVPVDSSGTTYARLRLSTDAAAANATGWAKDGEVEDHLIYMIDESPLDLHAQYGFYGTGNLYQNFGGLNERWFRDRLNNWLYILPDGSLFVWDGTPATASGEKIAQLAPIHYDDTTLLFDPQSAEPDFLTADQLKQRYGFYSRGNLLPNWGNWQELWFQDNRNRWYFLTVSGRLFHWNGERDLAGSMEMARTDAAVYQDLTLLFPIPFKFTAEEEQQLKDLQNEHEFRSTGDFFRNWLGWGEIWFKDKEDQWYFLIAGGELRRWDGVSLATSAVVANVHAAVFDDVDKYLFNA